MSQVLDPVEARYHRTELGEHLLQALREAGKNLDALTPDDLAPIDEFHIRGREATLELIRLAGFHPGSEVLDVGCGIGGPSRLLAQTCGCRVTGLDLTDAFCSAARLLAERTGLSDRVSYHHGDALHMPFEAQCFDGVWMQHVTMNIPDKPALFAEVARVLRPGGRLALYEIIRASDEPLEYPVPWARREEISFVGSEDEMRSALKDAALEIRTWEDVTEPGADWFRSMLERIRASGPPPLGLHVLVGPDMARMAGNVLRNLEAGRIRIVRAVAEDGRVPL